jgi:hypothetical protein
MVAMEVFNNNDQDVAALRQDIANKISGKNYTTLRNICTVLDATESQMTSFARVVEDDRAAGQALGLLGVPQGRA